MRYAVIGGDIRFVHLVRMLNEEGYAATGFLQERADSGAHALRELENYSCFIANWPMSWPLSGQEVNEAEIMEHILPGSTLLLCGPGFPQQKRWDLEYINLWADEELLQENAYLTAEGAVASAMRRTNRAMFNLPCLVIGYGRIGRALTELLLNLGARVTVASRSEAKRRKISAVGAGTVDTAELAPVLPGRKLIFSTPPASVLGLDLLRYVDGDALLVDLASAPYGIDMEAAISLGLHACREPALPGRCCPLSAARALYCAIQRWKEADSDE